MRVVHTQQFGYIDLDHVLVVEDARFIDHMGSGGYFVGFRVVMMFRDEPLQYMEEVSGKDRYFEHKPSVGWYAKMEDGSERRMYEWSSDHDPNLRMLCLVEMQEQVDAFVRLWKGKKSKAARPKG